MLVEASVQENIKLINIFGEIGLENHSEFSESMLRSIQGDESIILVNMENVTYMNSMSLGIIVKSYSEAKKQNKELALCSLQENIKKLFVITKLDRIIKIYQNREEAIEFLKIRM